MPTFFLSAMNRLAHFSATLPKVNELLFEGQQQGGIGQGVSQALFEEVRYDPATKPGVSNLLTVLAVATGSEPDAVLDQHHPLAIRPLRVALDAQHPAGSRPSRH